MIMFIILEPHGIFGSNFVYICILTLSSNWYEKVDGASPSIILANPALLVKMLITLERRGAYGSNFEYLCMFNIVQPLVCKTVMRLHRASFWPIKLF